MNKKKTKGKIIQLCYLYVHTDFSIEGLERFKKLNMTGNYIYYHLITMRKHTFNVNGTCPYKDNEENHLAYCHGQLPEVHISLCQQYAWAI